MQREIHGIVTLVAASVGRLYPSTLFLPRTALRQTDRDEAASAG
jgi:hypothetical protein